LEREQEVFQMLFGKEHVDRYRETDGEEGHDWQGTTVLILTTHGRHSGESRSTPLIYGTHGDDYLVVASKGGAPAHPAWYLNLESDPQVEVQVRGDRFQARARTATAGEKPELWSTMVERWPKYDQYQQQTDRDIPVVVLERE
jgi:deazaflavin-dependent oxidoreductase (nitroreductase family)